MISKKSILLYIEEIDLQDKIEMGIITRMKCPKCGLHLKNWKGKCECGHKINFGHIPNPPKYLGYINDYEGILELSYMDKMNRLIVEFEHSTGIEIVVSVIGSTKPLLPENYAYFMFNKWKLGKKNGQALLILVVMSEKRIETEIGYGLESILSEEYTEKLLDEIIIPYFRESKYGEGLYSGVKNIIQEIREHLLSKAPQTS